MSIDGAGGTASTSEGDSAAKKLKREDEHDPNAVPVSHEESGVPHAHGDAHAHQTTQSEEPRHEANPPDGNTHKHTA